MNRYWKLVIFLVLAAGLVACGGSGGGEDYYVPETSPEPLFVLPSPAVAPTTIPPEGHILFSGGGEMDLPIMGISIAAGLGRSFAVDNNGILWNFGAIAGRVPAMLHEDIVSVRSSREGHQAISTDGTLVMWGRYTTHIGHHNAGNAEDYRNFRTNTVLADSNSWFFTALSNSGHLYGWGSASFRLSNYTTVPPAVHDAWYRTTPFRMFEGVRYVSLANASDWFGIITHENHLHFYGVIGRNTWLPAARPPVMQDVRQISMGDAHALIVTNDGRLYAFGENGRGQLGDGTTTNVDDEPIFIMAHVASASAGVDNSFAITYDGRLYGWGNNSGGKLGDGTMTQRLEPVFVMENVSAVDAGDSHTLAVTRAGRLYAWGANMAGQLGDGTNRASHEPIFVMDNIRP